MSAPRETRRSILTAAMTSAAAFSLFVIPSRAQEPRARIAEQVNTLERATVKGSHPPQARSENDIGRVAGETKLDGITLVFSRSAEQEADLQTLLASQQDPSSSLYHKWLTPDEFGVRFGMADSDISAVKLWLEQQGFSVDGISRSKSRITFSGTAQQAESAFGTELHYYYVNGIKHFAPNADLTIPVTLSPVVQAVTNLSTFKPHSRVKFHAPQRAPKANFTSSQTGNHFLTPKDVATIYNINPAYNAGYTGSGQSIAVVGQSAIVLSDIENFQTAAGFSKKDPTIVLVPNSGTSTVVSGDESESDLDLEYSSTIGRGATVYFVYVGNSPNKSVWDSISYAVDNKVALIITTSYGACETGLGSSDYGSLNAVLAQAASQGQTVLVPSGDDGSTDCSGEAGLTTAQQQAVAVDFPASSQYVTGMGGTEFPAADVAVTNTTYWEPERSTDIIGSALSYIPEEAWNDDSTSGGLSAGGGGVSAFTARPSWQKDVAGIPSGNFRLVPDISLAASPNNVGYLYCSSDTASTGVTGSCSNGFRDSSNTNLTVAGGTSFGGPIFAGMLSILGQKLNSSGLGVINSTLYTLAANSATYASAFHDVTSGNNECIAGATLCSGAAVSDYSAGTGYDEATGLGSINFDNLLSAWPSSSTTSLTSSVTALSAATAMPTSGANDVISITVSSGSSSVTTTPTGTLSIAVDGTTVNSSLALSNGAATYTFSSTSAGSHTVNATYSGDSVYATSTGTVTLTVGSSAASSFTLAATNATISAGNTGTSTITITSKNGYTGTLAWTVNSSPTIANACFVIPNTTVSGTNAVTTTMTVYTSSTSCANVSIATGSGKHKSTNRVPVASLNAPPKSPTTPSPIAPAVGFGFSGLIFMGLAAFTYRKHNAFGAILLFCAIGFAVAGCSSSSTSSSTSTTTTNASKGTYTVTITGTDTSTSSITASTTMTLTID